MGPAALKVASVPYWNTHLTWLMCATWSLDMPEKEKKEGTRRRFYFGTVVGFGNAPL